MFRTYWTNQTKMIHKVKWIKLYFIYGSLCFMLSFYFGSRAFMIGTLAGIFFLFFHELNFKTFKLKFWISSILILFAVYLTVFFKQDSSLGRLLIYKISFNIYQNHWLQGLGFGNFKNAYLMYQADYFRMGGYSTKELLLADNTYFAFNDYFQWIIETGLTGTLILILFVIGLFRLIQKNLIDQDSIIIKIAVLNLIMISVAAIFIHVFERAFFQLIFLISLYLISFSLVKNKIVLNGTLVIAMLFFVYIHWGYKMVYYKDLKDFRQAKEQFYMGYRSQSMNKFDELYKKLYDHEEFLYTYADLTFNNMNYKKAAILYYKLFNKRKSNKIALRLASSLDTIGYNKNKVESWYKLTVLMVPNRFLPREALFNFYVKMGEQKKAEREASIILALPVKIPSKEIDLVRYRVTKKLIEIKN